VFEFLFIAGYVLIPLGFGLVPGFLPPRSRPVIRWALWLALLALAIDYIYLSRNAPRLLWLLALFAISVSTGLSLLVLIAANKRARATRRRLARPVG
jgi:FtsH-binding integral membrane protein